MTSIHTLLLIVSLGLALPVLAAEPVQISFQSLGDDTRISASLLKPDGDGPFPAVVIAHDCSGLGPHSSGAPIRWGMELLAQGYVVVIPDSFTPRGFADGVCTIAGSDSRIASGYVRTADIYAALKYLRGLDYVDGKNVGVMGGSHGGWTTLATMTNIVRDNEPVRQAKQDGFAAGIALYPSCGSPYGSWDVKREKAMIGPIVAYSGIYKPLAPVLILVGDKDDWTPAEPCRRLVETSRAAGYAIDIVVYPGAYHSFDSDHPVRYDARRTNSNSPTGKGATTGGDADAWSDARKRVSAFFDLHLKQGK
jgi:dienelactone hydrolase